MIKINVGDAKEVLKEYALPSRMRQGVANTIRDQLLSETYVNIVALANRTLKSSKQEYIDGIVIKRNSIDLEGWLPNSIEDGVSGFDMKEGFSRSSKKKSTKTGGWYLTIPFRVFTPGSNYQNAMSWQVYRAVKAGKSYNAGPAGQRAGFTDMATGKIFNMYQHKSSIFSGIKKTPSSSGRSNTYTTFRRVGSGSSPESWIHRGIIANKLFDKAWAQVDVESVINQVLSSL